MYSTVSMKYSLFSFNRYNSRLSRLKKEKSSHSRTMQRILKRRSLLIEISRVPDALSRLTYIVYLEFLLITCLFSSCETQQYRM